jgi:hypothetical protein
VKSARRASARLPQSVKYDSVMAWATIGCSSSSVAPRSRAARISGRVRRGMAVTDIHTICRSTAEDYAAPGNYVLGANIAGFLKVADTMLDLGVV